MKSSSLDFVVCSPLWSFRLEPHIPRQGGPFPVSFWDRRGLESVIYQRSLGLNVNLRWGILLLVFGIVMLGFGNRRRSVHRQIAARAQITRRIGGHNVQHLPS